MVDLEAVLVKKKALDWAINNAQQYVPTPTSRPRLMAETFAIAAVLFGIFGVDVVSASVLEIDPVPGDATFVGIVSGLAVPVLLRLLSVRLLRLAQNRD